MAFPSDSTPQKKTGYVPSTHPNRALFRVEFPYGKRPTLAWGGVSYEVLDISERGMRLSVDGRKSIPTGAKGRAVIQFEDSIETVAGTVLRGNSREAVFQLSEGFTLERIRREERRLIRAMLPPPSKP